MKTTGLTIVEACKAVRAGKAHHAKSETRTDTFMYFKGMYSVDDLLDTYTLIDPVIPTRKLEVVKRWVNLLTGDCKQEHMMPNDFKSPPWVELTGYYEKPIPEPEPLEFEGKIYQDEWVIGIWFDEKPPVDLQGRRCRVIVAG